MRIVFAVFLLFIAYVASYPSVSDSATDNDENDLELELRAILNQLDEEQMTRSLANEEDNEDDANEVEYSFSKRQGGHNAVDGQSTCEIKCIYEQRNPKTGKGKSVKEASKACKRLCPNTNKKEGKKASTQRKVSPSRPKLSLREFNDDDDDESQSSEEDQEIQRRELYNSLMEQLQQNNDE